MSYGFVYHNPLAPTFRCTSVDSGLEDVPPAGSVGAGLQSDNCDLSEGDESSPRILLCVLPRLAVEVSRLELVVLADMLGGFTTASDDVANVGPPKGHTHTDVTPSHSLEVVVEARGATVVLHEAAAFAEDPGPHSFVLNLGGACLRVADREKLTEGNATPIVTMSAGDICVHETLRCSLGGHSCSSAGERVNGPLLFFPGKCISAHPMVQDLSALGFVSRCNVHPHARTLTQFCTVLWTSFLPR